MAENVPSWKKVQAALDIVSGLSFEETAKKAGVSRRTLNRWAHSPEFSEALEIAQDAMLGAAVNVLLAESEGAVRVLAHEAKSADESIDRTRAAGKILDATLRFLEARRGVDK